MSRKKSLGLYVFILLILGVGMIVFFNLLKKEYILIPYSNLCGQPKEELINITLSQFNNIKKLRKIYLKEKFFLKKSQLSSLYAKSIFTEKLLFQYNLTYDDFNYKQNFKTYNILNESFHELKMVLNKDDNNYMKFLFKYKNNYCKGLSTSYSIFYDINSTYKENQNKYQYTLEIEKDWFIQIETTLNTDSIFFENNFISREDNKIWEYLTPPIELLIEPFQKNKITDMITLIGISKK